MGAGKDIILKRKAAILLALILIITSFVKLSLQSAQNKELDLELPSLAKIYEDYFLIGSVFSPRDFNGDRYEFITHHFNVLTAENAMKPDAMQNKKGSFTFAQVDETIEKISAAGILLHGHTLAWHNQSPAWLNKGVSRTEAEQNLKDHVMGVAGHYAGKVLSWDVLNEAMNDNPADPSDWRSGLRIADWYKAFAQEGNGEDYIDMLFRTARAADPDAILYYNDYNLNNRNKALAVANMVKELNDAYLAEGNTRLLIEGIGMQGHYSTSTTIESVEESIKLFSGLGVEISITELDVGVGGAAKSGLTEEDEKRQALVYAELFSVFKKYSDSIARVTFWGVNDALSWRADQFPLLFRADYSAKPAYYAVADPEGYLAEYGVNEKQTNVQPFATAAYGTPVIDGIRDDIWDITQELPVNQMLQAWQTASGTARVLWDEENLYVFFEVKDDILDNSSANPWECDSVEVFIDEENCKNGAYKNDDGQYRVSYKNQQSFGESTDIRGFESAAADTGTSYIVEMKIPVKVKNYMPDVVIGFDLQINDAKNGSRTGIAMWCDVTGDSWQNTDKWGELMLIEGDDSILLEQKDDTKNSDTNEDGNKNSDTQDKNTIDENQKVQNNNNKDNDGNPIVIIIAVILIIASGVLGMVYFKRFKNGNKY